MTLSDFHRFVDSMWVTYPAAGEIPAGLRSLSIATMGLAGENGEVIEHIKKYIRDDRLDRDALQKELGDLIFYWLRLHTEFGLDPQQTLQRNVDKLTARRAAGTIQGKGNDR